MQCLWCKCFINSCLGTFSGFLGDTLVECLDLVFWGWVETMQGGCEFSASITILLHPPPPFRAPLRVPYPLVHSFPGSVLGGVHLDSSAHQCDWLLKCGCDAIAGCSLWHANTPLPPFWYTGNTAPCIKACKTHAVTSSFVPVLPSEGRA